MHRLLPAVLIALAAVAAPAAAEPRQVSGFTAVTVADRIEVEITTGEAFSVEVTGQDAGRIITRLDGRTLRVRDRNRPWFGETPDLDAHVRVTAPSLSALSASRGAELRAAIGDDCRALDVAASMGGEAAITISRCDAVSASASMGGDVRLEGACDTLSASASMGGLVRAEGLRCATVNASASMGGDIEAYASSASDASASMGGAIAIAGNPRSNNNSTALGGSVSN